MTLREIERRLNRHPLMEYEIPLQVKTGLPYLYVQNERLFLRYSLHRQRYEDGVLLIGPKQYELKLVYPFQRIVWFEDRRIGRMDDPEHPVWIVKTDHLLTEGKLLLDEWYEKADQAIALWEKDRALFVNSLLDCQNAREKIIKEFCPEPLQGG